MADRCQRRAHGPAEQGSGLGGAQKAPSGLSSGSPTNHVAPSISADIACHAPIELSPPVTDTLRPGRQGDYPASPLRPTGGVTTTITATS
jgi:hypothetical protein